jgi:hypothetical protein
VRCSGITREGHRCERSADGPNGLCWLHDPTRSEDRRRGASRGGRSSKASREISGLKAYLDKLAKDVRSGELDAKVGTVVNQIVNTRLRALEMERAIRETDQLAFEVEELRKELNAEQRRFG